MTVDRSDPRYCDVVMEGGVTSGVIYPGFVGALQEELELRCIGGTSAGAIAATGAAAAQLGQLALGTDDAPPVRPRPAGGVDNPRVRQGFVGLEDLAAQIVRPAPNAPEGELRLRQLFEPVASTRHLFRLADAVRPPKHLARRTKAGRIVVGLGAAIGEGLRSIVSPAAGRAAWLLTAFGLLLWMVAIGIAVAGGLRVLLLILGVLVALLVAAVGAERLRMLASPAARRTTGDRAVAIGLLAAGGLVAAAGLVAGGLGVLLGVLIVLFALVVSAAALAWALARRSLQVIADNQYGVVSGMPGDGAVTRLLADTDSERRPRMRSLAEADTDADYRLSEYFTRVFDELAGIEDGERDGHLTFGDLWGLFEGPLDAAAMRALCEERGQPPTQPVPRALRAAPTDDELRRGAELAGSWPADRLINLELISTCMTLGRPFTFPLDPEADVPGGGRWPLDPGFYWNSAQLERLFPPSVIEQMADASAAPVRWTSRQHGRVDLRPLPPPWRLPVIVPMRMSLSVPVFFSAVPLWKRQGANRHLEDHEFVLCWFADGGITSNLPIHFFDSPAPPWPTFAINLSEPDPDIGWRREGSRSNLSRNVRLWRVFGATNIDREGASPFSRLRALVSGGVVTTARKWSDTVQAMRAPYNERVIHVALTPEEGGFNLNMTEETIDELRAHGFRAGAALVKEFRTGAWPKHRRARIRSTLAAMASAGADIEAGRGTPAVDDALRSLRLRDAELSPSAVAGLRALAARVAGDELATPTPGAPRLPTPNPAQRQRVRF